MYTLTYEQITAEFEISRVVATLGLSLFVMGLGIGPMVLGPLSEVRKSVFSCITAADITSSTDVDQYMWCHSHFS